MIVKYLHSAAGALALICAIWVWLQLRLNNPVGSRRARWGGWLIALLVWLGVIGGSVTLLKMPAAQLETIAAAQIPWVNTVAPVIKKPLAMILFLFAGYLPVLLRSIRLREMNEAGKLVRTTLLLLIILLVMVIGLGVLVSHGYRLGLAGEVL
jgi:hypothetical protein